MALPDLSRKNQKKEIIMPSYNKVILAGNLTRDPEIKYTPKGTAIARLGLAVNRTWKTESGEKKEEVTFVDVDAFGKQAETLAQYLKKGRPLLVEGRLRLDQWESNDGEKRSKLGVVLESFQFLGSGKQSDTPREQPKTSPAQSELPVDEDGVPF